MGLKIQPNYAVNPKNLKDVIYKQLYAIEKMVLDIY